MPAPKPLHSNVFFASRTVQSEADQPFSLESHIYQQPHQFCLRAPLNRVRSCQLPKDLPLNHNLPHERFYFERVAFIPQIWVSSVLHFFGYCTILRFAISHGPPK
ncbi:hypothetical protein BaRGS_00006373 [Batillaria attramentaria]|uniref:Uncharacterized protein n=1 Tax=Batillaria attramentaria TaxID=370345 RepID=A0ABD0LSA7_9CAEN